MLSSSWIVFNCCCLLVQKSWMTSQCQVPSDHHLNTCISKGQQKPNARDVLHFTTARWASRQFNHFCILKRGRGTKLCEKTLLSKDHRIIENYCKKIDVMWWQCLLEQTIETRKQAECNLADSTFFQISSRISTLFTRNLPPFCQIGEAFWPQK